MSGLAAGAEEASSSGRRRPISGSTRRCGMALSGCLVKPSNMALSNKRNHHTTSLAAASTSKRVFIALTRTHARACTIECDTRNVVTSAAAVPLAATDKVRKWQQPFTETALHRSLARRRSAHLLSGTNIQPRHVHVMSNLEQDPTPHECACQLPLGLSAGFSGSLVCRALQLDGPRLPTGVLLYMSRADDETNVRDCMTMSPCQM